MVRLSDMEILTSREAADLLGISPQAWHRLVAKERLVPVKEVPGIRGAKFWKATDVMRVAVKREAGAVA